jgi:ethanolamine utilization protein EutQ (cupin superfamily)
MRKRKENLPVIMEAGPANMQAADWGEMKSAYMRMGDGVDFTPTLQGLPDDLCQAPHWGYVLEGEIQVRYTDGREESIEAGQLYYLPPGHTVWFEEATEFVEFSPRQGMDEVLAHIEKQMQAA